jgi:glycerophosphoryl diester phosphodiesterase
MKNMERFLPALGFKPRYLNPHFSLVDCELSAYLHAHDIRMIPWTVNSKEDMLAMQHIGAAGIITDYPELALALFDV